MCKVCAVEVFLESFPSSENFAPEVDKILTNANMARVCDEAWTECKNLPVHARGSVFEASFAVSSVEERCELFAKLSTEWFPRRILPLDFLKNLSSFSASLYQPLIERIVHS